MGQATLAQLAAAVPAGLTLLGVDEDTALVRVDADGPSSAGPARWHVQGRQGVSVFAADAEVRHPAGTTLTLDLDGADA